MGMFNYYNLDRVRLRTFQLKQPGRYAAGRPDLILI